MYHIHIYRFNQLKFCISQYIDTTNIYIYIYKPAYISVNSDSNSWHCRNIRSVNKSDPSILTPVLRCSVVKPFSKSQHYTSSINIINEIRNY